MPHDDLTARRAIDAADDRDGRRENERARRGDHEDREHTQRIVRREPGGAAGHGGRGCEPYGVPIGEALQRRLAGLSRAHELDDSRVLALGRECGRPEPEHTGAVERAAHDMRAPRRIHGRRFTGERGDIEV